jgi:hypothetical protein
VDIVVDYGDGETEEPPVEEAPEDAPEDPADPAELLFREQALDPGDPYYEEPVEETADPVEIDLHLDNSASTAEAPEVPEEAPEPEPMDDMVDL